MKEEERRKTRGETKENAERDDKSETGVKRPAETITPGSHDHDRQAERQRSSRLREVVTIEQAVLFETADCCQSEEGRTSRKQVQKPGRGAVRSEQRYRHVVEREEKKRRGGKEKRRRERRARREKREENRGEKLAAQAGTVIKKSRRRPGEKDHNASETPRATPR